MDYARLAGAGFLVAGIVSLLRFGIDPAATTFAVFSAIMGVGLCSLGFLWLTGKANSDTGTETAHDGRRITVPLAAIVAAALFVGGITAYAVI